MACPDVLEADDPLKAFSSALLNFHNHYCLDSHTSMWCKYHIKVCNVQPRVTTDIKCGNNYIIRKVMMVNHTIQASP